MEKQKKKQKGITLIALVISIIVMLILAGVSLNMTVGDNGIIKQAQNATYQSGMAALEEWLNQKYVQYYEDVDDYTSKPELLNAKIRGLLLKDGSRNYIISEGKVYYLINKTVLPNEIKSGLVGGDGLSYAQYTRLQDVYGVTPDLKVYYCDSESGTILGDVEVEDVDPNTSIPSINKDAGIKSLITDSLAAMGITVDDELGVTMGNVSALKKLEVDGSKYPITNLSAISEIKNLQTLTLSNLTLTDLNGLEGPSNLNCLYLKNCTVGDYTNLETVINLKYLYLYFPSSMSETIANGQVTKVGEGLQNASNLTKLEYMSISGATDFVEGSAVHGGYSYSMTSSANKFVLAPSSRSNVSDISGITKINQVIKSNIKYLYLNNNKITSLSTLAITESNGVKSGYTGLVDLCVFCNSTLTNLTGLENHTNLQYVTAQNCGLTSISALSGCTALKYLTIQDNTGLTSLTGIENNKNIYQLLAYSCGLTDITALASHTTLNYIDIKNNITLQNVITLGSCTGIRNLYLANNTNMVGTDVRDALANESTTILAKCGQNYSIPAKYLVYFQATATSIDYSVASFGEVFTDTSDAFNALKNKTQVTRLNLSGQSGLSNTKLQEILETMTGLQYLNLSGCSNLSSINFVGNGKVTKLIELDIRSVNTSLTDLSNLNTYATSLKNLVINNPNINMSKIVTTLNRFNYGSNLTGSWLHPYQWGLRGLAFFGNWSSLSFANCNGLTHLVAVNSFNDSETEARQTRGTLDLSGTSVTSVYTCYGSVKVPSTCSYLYTRMGAWDLSLASGAKDFIFESDVSESSLNSIFSTLNTNARPKTIHLGKNHGATLGWLQYMNKSELESITLSGNGSAYQPAYYTDLSALSGCTNLKKLQVSGQARLVNLPLTGLTNLEQLTIADCPKIANITGLNTCTSLSFLNIYSCGVLNSLPGLENLSSVTALNVYNTAISNIGFMNNKTNLQFQYQYDANGNVVVSNGTNVVLWDTLYLHNNNISDITPLLNIITQGRNLQFTKINISNNPIEGNVVANNMEVLRKLKVAGLTDIVITGTSFTANEVEELKTLYGASHVTN